MATGVVDILLRILGDSKDAVRAVDDVGQAADRTEAKVSRTETALKRAAGSVAKFAGQLSVAFAVASEVGQKISDTFENLTGTTGQDITGADKAILAAGSTEEVAAAFNAAQNKRSGIRGRLARIVRGATTRGAWGGISESWDALRDELSGTRETTTFDTLFAADPARAAALAGTNPAWRDRLNELQGAANRAAAYKAQLSGDVQIININQAIGDRAQVGRTIEAARQARARNNGHTVTSYSRRG